MRKNDPCNELVAHPKYPTPPLPVQTAKDGACSQDSDVHETSANLSIFSWFTFITVLEKQLGLLRLFLLLGIFLLMLPSLCPNESFLLICTE